MPYGCGEQTMINSGPNVYALMNLKGVGIIKTNSDQYQQHLDKIENGKISYEPMDKMC